VHANVDMSARLAFKQHLLAHVLQPMVRRLPTSLWSVAALVIAGLGAPMMALRSKTMLHRVLRMCGRRPNWSAACALAARMGYHRLRKLDYYLHGGCRDVRVDWKGAPPDTLRCVYVLMDTYGAEQIDAFIAEHPSWLLRRRFDEESEPSIALRSHTQPWSAHCARLRLHINPDRTIDVHADPLKMRHAINSPQSIVAFQGYMQSLRQDNSDRMFLGHMVSMPLGAVRLAQRAGLPIRFLTIKPHISHWTITVEPTISANAALLQARMERALLEAPEGWSLWEDFLNAADSSTGHPAPGAQEAVAPRIAAQSLPTGATENR
jgi:hypothetical protein